MGAWIEILLTPAYTILCIVAPPVGAWIEISDTSHAVPLGSVAPPVGAWIEILDNLSIQINTESLPPWERGLKLEAHNCQWKTTDVAPPVGAWIEIAKDKNETSKSICRSPRGSVD